MQKPPKFDPSKIEGLRQGRLRRAVLTPPTAKKLPTPNMKWLCFCGLGVLTLCFLTFANAMLNKLVFNDSVNYTMVRDVADQQQFWVELLCSAVLSPYSAQLAKASFAVDILGFGADNNYTHWTNMLLHVANSVLFFALVFRVSWFLHLVKRTTLNPYVLATAAAGFFCCHPLPGGSVAYSSARATLLLALNYLIAMHFFISGFTEQKLSKAIWSLMFAAFFLAMGVFSSYQIISLPFMCMGVMTIMCPRDVSLKQWVRDRWAEYVLAGFFGVVLLGFLVIKVPKLVDNGLYLLPLNTMSYLATQGKALITYYLRCCVAPFGLSIDPPWVIANGFADPLALLGWALLIAMALLLWKFRKNVFLASGIGLTLVSILPWFLRVQPEYVSDQRFYMPMLGISILVGYGFAVIFSKVKSRKLVFTGGGIVLVGLAVLSIWRNVGWREHNVLWWQALKLNPASRQAEGEIALGLAEKNQPENSKKHADIAIQQNPDEVVGRIAVADFHYRMRAYAKSLKELEEVVALEKKIGMTPEQTLLIRRDLARAYFKMGDLQKASMVASAVKEILRNDTQMHLIVGKVYLKGRQLGLAISELQTAYKLDPKNPDVTLPFATAVIDTGEEKNLVTGYRLATQALYTDRTAEALLQIVRAAIGVGKLEIAEQRLDTAITMDKSNPGCIYLASVLTRLRGNEEQADRLKKLAESRDKNVASTYSVVLPNAEIVALEKRRYGIELQLRKKTEDARKKAEEAAKKGDGAKDAPTSGVSAGEKVGGTSGAGRTGAGAAGETGATGATGASAAAGAAH